jgi:hypothetical protein
MAVVSKYGTGYRDPTSLKAIDAIQRGAEIRVIKSKATITNGDSSTSKYFLGSVPSNAKPNPGAKLYWGAATSVVSADLGIANPNGGAMILQTALIAAQDIHLAGSTDLFGATGSGVATPANMDKAFWQLAGLTSDPGGELDLVLTINNAATATADVFLEGSYAKGA